MKKQRITLKLILFIFLSLLISGCDPMCSNYLSVDRVSWYDNAFYLHSNRLFSIGIGCDYSSINDHFFISSDQGRTWVEILTLPNELNSNTHTENQIGKTVCEQSSSTCYTIALEGVIRFSQDFPKTTSFVWKPSKGRSTYMERVLSWNNMLGVTPDYSPFDIALGTYQGNSTVVVAMGNQGVLVVSPEGNWKQVSVVASDEHIHPATPTSHSSTDMIFLKKILSREILWAEVFTILFFFAHTIYSWVVFEKVGWRVTKYKYYWGCFPLSLVFLGAFILFLVGFAYSDDNIYLACSIPIAGTIILWILNIIFLKQRQVGFKVIFLSIGSTITFLFTMLAPFYLWGFGTIPTYEISFTISVLLSLGVIVLSVLILRKIVAKAKISISQTL